MKSVKLAVAVFLFLSLSVIGLMPQEVRAGKGLGIEKKQYIKSYNRMLSKFDLRFEKVTSSTAEDVYKLSNDTAYVSLKPGGSKQLEEITLIVMKVEGRPDSEFSIVMGLGMALAVEPDPTTATINSLSKKFKDKMEEGLNEFSFDMGNKRIEVEVKKPGAVFVTIKP